jgi:hypothetical protein
MMKSVMIPMRMSQDFPRAIADSQQKHEYIQPDTTIILLGYASIVFRASIATGVIRSRTCDVALLSSCTCDQLELKHHFDII